jgi:hypothetical protein
MGYKVRVIQSKLRSGIVTGLALMFVMAMPFLLCGVLVVGFVMALFLIFWDEVWVQR